MGESIRGFLLQWETELQRRLRELKARPANDETAARQSVEKGLLEESARMMEQFGRSETAKLREVIDSPARLATLSASCNVRIGELESRIRRGEREL